MTEVTFAELSDEEIDYYIRGYKPMEKAGSYGIQEWIGYIGVWGISGSYFNVMGLPVQCLYIEKPLFPGAAFINIHGSFPDCQRHESIFCRKRPQSLSH